MKEIVAFSSQQNDNEIQSSSDNRNNNDNNTSKEALIDFVAGALGGTVGKLLEYPIDLLKTRLQSGLYEGKSTLQICSHIIRNEGAIRGFYRGVAMPVFGCAAEVAVAFAVFNWTTHFLLSNPAARSFFNLQQNRDENSYTVVAISGAMAGFANAFTLSPIEVIKCRVQASPQKYVNVRQCIRVSVREEGWRVFAAGFSGTMAREIPGAIGFFIVLEFSLRNFFGHYRVTHEEFLEHQRKLQDDEQCNLKKGESFACAGELKESAPWYVRPICGGFAGFGLVCAPYGADTIKTVLQISPEAAKMGFFATGRDLVRKGGVRSLFRGLPITMVRAFPANAAVFSTYDIVANYLLKHF